MKAACLPTYFVLIIVFLSGCQNNEVNPEVMGGPACEVSNPLTDLGWLKVMVEDDTETDYCHVVSVIQGVYNGQVVFIPVLSGALCCTCGNSVYDCNGEIVFSCDQEAESKITNRKEIWSKE